MATTIATGSLYPTGDGPGSSAKINAEMAEIPAGSDVLEKLATKLSAARGGETPIEPVDLVKRARLLRIARDVAHATERQNAPLAAYLIGRFVQNCVEKGMSEAAALDQATEVVRSLVGEGGD